MLPFVSSRMKDNVEVIHFHVKVGVHKAMFCANNVWKVYRKYLFWKRRSWYKNRSCQYVTLISMKRFPVFTQS